MEQLNLPFIENVKAAFKIYEIYKVDPSFYPHERRYYSHMMFLEAASPDVAIMDFIGLCVKKDSQTYYDVREVNKHYILEYMEKLEFQLHNCQKVLQFLKTK